MQKESSTDFLFIINPVSGNRKLDWEKNIRSYFKERSYQLRFYQLSGQDDSGHLQHYIQTLRPAKVVAVGGDGTIKLVAELVKETPIVLGIIPAGSANGMAKELSIPADLTAALKVLVSGTVRPIDVIKINDKEISLHLSDIGLNAMLVRYFEKTDGRGMWTYAKGLFKALWVKKEIYATIKTDTESIKRKAYMVVIANATKYGTGATINPDGNIADGFFETIIVRRLTLFELFKMLVTHKGFNADCIEVLRTKHLSLTTLHKVYFQIDGEYRNRVKYITAAIMPHALNVMVPDSKG